MPVRDIRCPVCGVEVRMGLPRDATVKGVFESDDETEDDAANRDGSRKLRRLSCSNDHVFGVLFEVEGN
ncbi:MAG: transcriptional regulator [Halobacteria archaeon]|nr:transcriptional regulator [Halobacteria archaeon]